ncbi:MAG: 2-phosphoglycerate kinase [Clostridium sp.]
MYIIIILIGGESHVGKTLLAQRLLEKYKIPYTSLDHIKMGLIRGYDKCGFMVTDSDDVISQKMWNVLKGIINTCEENEQNIILEGCYFPPEKVKEIVCEDIISVYIGFSEEYIQKNFDKIIGFENVIEKRKYPEERTQTDFIVANNVLKEKCINANLPYFEIKLDYTKEIQLVYDFIESRLATIKFE